ncbi:hypothetical protein EDD11_003344 [Mortierella claussenii]|nr:hypothetical protein EDD11_003344 [Mortierella claussenii]
MPSSSSTIRTRPHAAKNPGSMAVSDTSDSTSSTTTAHAIGGQDSKGIFTISPQDTRSTRSCASAHASTAADESTSSTALLNKKNEKPSRTCTWDELPLWMHDNPAILTGYRRETFSYRKCLASLGYLHNETVNIYSHLLGALICIIGAPFVYFSLFDVLDTIKWTDVAVFYVFLAGAVICLSMSASFHTFSCHSEPVAHQWNRCDYVGIVFLIAGSFYPAIFYGFYCFKIWQIMYIGLITAFGAATIVAVIRPEFRTPQYRWVRSCLFMAMGLSAVFPVIHAIVLYGIHLAQDAIALNYMICMGSSYVFGALLYGSRTPERFFPGKLDYVGASHQIFHICVLLGVLSHFLGVTKAMAFWHDANHSCAIPISEMRAAY